MQSSRDSRLWRHVLIFMTAGVIVSFTLNAFVFSILEVKSITDVDFMIPVLVDVIPYLTTLSEVIGMLIAYSCIIFSAHRFGKSGIKKTIVLYIFLTLYKYAAKVASGIIINGTIAAFKEIWYIIIYSVIIPFVLDMVMIALIAAITVKINKQAEAFIKKQNKISKALPEHSFEPSSIYFPITKLWNLQNPLQRSVYYTAIMVFLSQAVQLFVVDIDLGLPTNLMDFIWMVSSYLMSVLLGAASYLFMLYVLVSINRKDISLKYE